MNILSNNVNFKFKANNQKETKVDPNTQHLMFSTCGSTYFNQQEFDSWNNISKVNKKKALMGSSIAAAVGLVAPPIVEIISHKGIKTKYSTWMDTVSIMGILSPALALLPAIYYYFKNENQKAGTINWKILNEKALARQVLIQQANVQKK